MEGSFNYSYSGEMSPAMMIFNLVVLAFYLYCGWKLFTKAGQPGWASIIPIYNAYVMLKICGKPGWWLILMLIPLVNFVIVIILMQNLSQRFGKGTGFTLGLVFLSFIFIPILALDSSKYSAPATV
jgi:hypothetical protein